MDIHAGSGVAVREYPLRWKKSVGWAAGCVQAPSLLAVLVVRTHTCPGQFSRAAYLFAGHLTFKII